MTNIQKTTPVEIQWTPQQIELIKSQIAYKEIKDDELALFGQVCSRTGLDPFARQIYAVPRKVKIDNQYVTKMSIQVSIDGFRLQADRSGKYAGSETFWCGEDGIWHDVWLSNQPPTAAKTVVYKLGSDRAFSGVARFAAYKQTYKDGNLSSQWATMPEVMIGKCSEALALRKAFPAELSGLYSREEMQQAENDVDFSQVPMATKQHADKINALRKQLDGSLDELTNEMLGLYGSNRISELTESDADQFIGILEKRLAVAMESKF